MMSQKKYLVTLTSDERDHLNDLLGKGKASALVLTHARIPLKADPAEGGPGWIDEHIAGARDASAATVERVRGSGSSGRGWNRPWAARSRTSPAGRARATGPARPAGSPRPARSPHAGGWPGPRRGWRTSGSS